MAILSHKDNFIGILHFIIMWKACLFQYTSFIVEAIASSIVFYFNFSTCNEIGKFLSYCSFILLNILVIYDGLSYMIAIIKYFNLFRYLIMIAAIFIAIFDQATFLNIREMFVMFYNNYLSNKINRFLETYVDILWELENNKYSKNINGKLKVLLYRFFYFIMRIYQNKLEKSDTHINNTFDLLKEMDKIEEFDDLDDVDQSNDQTIRSQESKRSQLQKKINEKKNIRTGKNNLMQNKDTSQLLETFNNMMGQPDQITKTQLLGTLNNLFEQVNQVSQMDKKKHDELMKIFDNITITKK